MKELNEIMQGEYHGDPWTLQDWTAEAITIINYLQDIMSSLTPC